jgi:YHS domain-containing protein
VPTANEPDALIDPVCGAPVGLDSLYRRAQGGALYCFCSARCLDRFALDPGRFLLRAETWGRTWGPDARGADEEAASDQGPASAPTATRPDTFPTIAENTRDRPRGAAATGLRLRAEPAGVGRAPARAATSSPGILAGVGWFELFAGILPWRERRFARRVSRELLNQYRIVSAAHPGLRGRDLYRKIVILRTHADPESADTLINQAEQSFAAWPVARELKFCDVVHFIAVSEFLASHGNSPWIHANVGREVSSHIPHNL